MTEAHGSVDEREALKTRLFARVDLNVDGKLHREEMHSLATMLGFDGCNEEWDHEYVKLCSEHGISPDDGIPKNLVMQMLEDESNAGCHCTTEELRALLEDTERPGEDASASTCAPFSTEPEAGNSEGDRGAATVFFAGASFSTEEAVLRQKFGEAGTIQDFQLFRLADGRSRGMGRVKFSAATEARCAVMSLHQQEIEGRRITVKPDHKKPTPGEEADTSKRGAAAAAGRGEGGRTDKGSGKASAKSTGAGVAATGKDFSAPAPRKSWRALQTGSSPASSSNCIFFAGASFDTQAAFLRKHFEEVGRVVQFWLFQLKDGRSRGMGVVQYQTAREARYAVEAMHGIVIDGRELLVKPDDVGALEAQGYSYDSASVQWTDHAWGKGGELCSGGAEASWAEQGANGGSCWSHRGASQGSWKGTAAVSNRIFFAGALFSTPSASLWEYFAEFGEVRSFTLFRLPDGRSRGMGVCTFCSAEAAAWVLSCGIEVEGWPLYLQEDTSQFVSEHGKGNVRQQQALTPYVPPVRGKGWKVQPQDYGMPYSHGDVHYGAYGGNNGCEADAWGNYGGIAHMDGYVDGYSSSRGNGGSRGGWGGRGGVASSPSTGVSEPSKAVFFANVPFGTTESHLQRTFETAGEIKKFNLFTTPDGRSRGMGVVEYTSQAAAQRAYNTLHETHVSGRPIIVDEYRTP